MGSVINLAQLSIIINVDASGSCGYHSFILGLKDIGKQDKFGTITDLRFNLYKHDENLFQKLRQHVIYL